MIQAKRFEFSQASLNRMQGINTKPSHLDIDGLIVTARDYPYGLPGDVFLVDRVGYVTLIKCETVDLDILQTDPYFAEHEGFATPAEYIAELRRQYDDLDDMQCLTVHWLFPLVKFNNLLLALNTMDYFKRDIYGVCGFEGLINSVCGWEGALIAHLNRDDNDLIQTLEKHRVDISMRMYRDGTITLERASHYAGMPVEDFLSTLKSHEPRVVC